MKTIVSDALKKYRGWSKELEGLKIGKMERYWRQWLERLLLRSEIRQESGSWNGNKERYLKNVVKAVIYYLINKFTQTFEEPVHTH